MTSSMSSSSWRFPAFDERALVKCDFLRRGNFTINLAPGYRGIPENLLINVISWVLLIIAYSVLNRTAKNYSRMALVHRIDQRWSEFIYGTQCSRDHDHIDDSMESLDNAAVRQDNGFLSWIWCIFLIKDRHVLKKNGSDAVQYLTFQRHIIVFVLVVCFCCVSIVLPIHVFGDADGDARKFEHTTIMNVDATSRGLWVHITLAFLFLPLGVVFMRHFSTKLQIHADESRVCRTLMIAGVPRRHCKQELFQRHFAEAYPSCTISDIQFAYDIRHLIYLDGEREVATQARLWCENYINDRNGARRPVMRPYYCGRLLVCGDCLGCKQVDALDYYTKEEEELLQKALAEKERAVTRPVGFVFITFETEEMAMLVCKDHKTQWQCFGSTAASELSKELKPHTWTVSFAPPPTDIFWENLSIGRWAWYIRSFFINFVLFIVLFFLTTPFIIMSSLSRVMHLQGNLNPFIERFLPTVLLWLVAALLPALVTLSDLFIAHWTRSARNHSVMRKIFIFLLFMVLILPSLGLTSAEGFIGWAFRTQNQTELWKCLYVPDSGAFFINYVITSSFVGTTMELIRFPQLCLYVIYTFLSRSRAENFSIHKNTLFEFYYGVHYAWYLLIFAIVMVYSLSCPLIVPFGLLYLCFKHCVDRYNIYFVYSPSRTNKYIHATAVQFVIASLMLLQFSLFMFCYFRTGYSSMTLTMCVIFMSCLVLTLGQLMVRFFRDFGPIKYVRRLQKTMERRSRNGQSKQFCYIPDVLRRRSPMHISHSATQLNCYGGITTSLKNKAPGHRRGASLGDVKLLRGGSSTPGTSLAATAQIVTSCCGGGRATISPVPSPEHGEAQSPLATMPPSPPTLALDSNDVTLSIRKQQHSVDSAFDDDVITEEEEEASRNMMMNGKVVLRGGGGIVIECDEEEEDDDDDDNEEGAEEGSSCSGEEKNGEEVVVMRDPEEDQKQDAAVEESVVVVGGGGGDGGAATTTSSSVPRSLVGLRQDSSSINRALRHHGNLNTHAMYERF